MCIRDSPPGAETVLRECLALGADHAVLVTDSAFGSADTLATSSVSYTHLDVYKRQIYGYYLSEL